MIRTSLLALLLSGAASAALAQADPHAGHAMPAAQAAPPAADPHAGQQTPTPAAAPDPHAGHSAAAGQADAPQAQGETIPDPHAGHVMPAAPAAADPHANHQMPSVPAVADPHAGHVMSAAPAAADPHAGHVMGAAAEGQTGADLPVGDASAPSVIRDNMADQVFDVRAMQRARAILEEEHGAVRISKLMANIAEYQAQPPGGGYRWDLEGWYGGDVNRFVFKSEGEGSGAEGVELAEVQGLYSRAVARYTDLQIGIRHDFAPKQPRTYATVGVESQFPYWFDLEAAAFLSDRGDLTARIEGFYDLRLTQRLVLQPQAELRLSAQSIPDLKIGRGFTHAELGLRLRYEIRREFAPYIGVAFERAFGRTADFIRGAGEDPETTTFVVGLRTWF